MPSILPLPQKGLGLEFGEGKAVEFSDLEPQAAEVEEFFGESAASYQASGKTSLDLSGKRILLYT